ncbi:MAG: PASTA domain-containing protein [Balneolaceae bacterium]|nr:MAG: PASTA domain-containing protein [Balneolaceae bacterium]
MDERSSILGKMFLLLGLLLLLPAAILVQIARINITEGEGFRELWSTQTIDYLTIPAQRGNIYDSRGSLLATNQVIYKVALDPHLLTDRELQTAAISRILSNHTGRTVQYYRNRISNASGRSRYIVLERSVPVQVYEELNELAIRGLILEEEYRRTYNFGSLASHALGYMNYSMEGISGLEQRYNSMLKGEDGLQQVRKDRLNSIYAYVGAPRKLPRQGYSLVTTLDAQIQAIAEEELESGIKRHRAKQGTVIIMDPRTGAVKAMANYPTFNPNRPASIQNENRLNFAISDQIEPGSTFKLVMALAALDQGVVNFTEQFHTPANGQHLIHGQWMRDHRPLGSLTFPEVVSRSSNIATAEIAGRIKPELFYQYTRNLGFGTPSQIDLPGENAGRLQRPFEWSLVTLPWMSIGYEVQVTPLQLTQAYAAIANNGILMKPYIVDSIHDEFGNVIEQIQPKRVRRVAKESTIRKLIPLLEEVVSDSGTAAWASVDGLRIAGKTGTAQKFSEGRYQSRYRASFVGFFPAENPEIVMLVLLDEPSSSIFGGFTAGSIFREIAARISGMSSTLERAENRNTQIASGQMITPNLKGIDRISAETLLKEKRIPYQIQGTGNIVLRQDPEPGATHDRNIALVIEVSTLEDYLREDGLIRIPDVRGMSMRQAVYTLTNLGLDSNSNGSGNVMSQFPAPGEFMRPGRTITLRGQISLNDRNSIIAAN